MVKTEPTSKANGGRISPLGEFALDQKDLIDLIDKIQQARVQGIKIPRIVVVGDQNAGKSSLLQSVTGVNFPHDRGACTRFPTEIRLRTSSVESLHIKIDPHHGRNPSEAARLQQFGRNVPVGTPFEAIIAQATALISPSEHFQLANDVLIVTYHGPQYPLLTVMDLPGLVRNRNANQSEDIIQGIDAMADRYLRSPRTIILTVIGGNTDLALTQGPMKARDFDPSGSRTMGVLTKPDLCAGSGYEDLYANVLRGQDPEHRYQLGWHVVLNPGPGKGGVPTFWTDSERAAEEAKFFSQAPWNSLSPEFIGASALRKALSVKLTEHIAKFLPQLRAELQADLEKSEEDLDALGPGSDKPEEMRKMLIRLSEKSKNLISRAVDGTYINPDHREFFSLDIVSGGTPSTKLRALAAEQNDCFAEIIEKQGRRVEFRSKGMNGGPGRSLDLLNVEWTSPRSKLPSTTEEEFAQAFVAEFIRQNRGTEPKGDYKPGLIYPLFQWYSKNWNDHALRHQEVVGDICNRFLNNVIQHDWPKHYQGKLRKTLVDREMKKLFEFARAEVRLLDDSRRFNVGPYNADYRAKYEEWIEKKNAGERTSALELLQKMVLYYQLSATTYISNVISQVIERHLLEELPKVISPTKIADLSDEEVVAIAGEEGSVRDKRVSIRQHMEDVEASIAACVNATAKYNVMPLTADELDADDSGDESEDSIFSSPPGPITPLDSGLSSPVYDSSSSEPLFSRSSSALKPAADSPFHRQDTDLRSQYNDNGASSSKRGKEKGGSFRDKVRGALTSHRNME